MKLLLDTHVLLWAWADPDRLSTKVREYLESPAPRLVSAASLWEIAIKLRLGKLSIPRRAATIPAGIAALQAAVVPVRGNHALRTLELPEHHKDPFDRLLVAQAIEEGAMLATLDENLRKYAVDIFW